MEKKIILSQLKAMLNKYKTLPLYIQKENEPIKMFIEDEYKSIKNHDKVDRETLFHPQALFEFAEVIQGESIKQYFERKGESIDNIIGVKTLSVLDSKANQYISLYL